ncbi:MAG: IS630 family transposase [Planctomycetaceae bacterium]|nr:IS630 family transposase [Planctomycetaceae bacterium]
MRPFGSASELENRRRLAVTRVLEGDSQAEVARVLGVHPRTVRQGVADYRRQGDAALAAKPQPGRTPKLSPEQEQIVLSWSRKHPSEFGFPTVLWTAPRVAQLIERTFGVKFHPRYLNAWLMARKITPQKPKRPARERDQDAIDRGIDEDWPRIQGMAREQDAHIVSIDETGVPMAPLVRRSLAPRGETPILKQKGARREKVSSIAALALSPRQHRPGLDFQIHPKAFVNNIKAAAFVRQLLRHLRGKVVLIWDRGTMHRGDPIRGLLRDYARLTIEEFPAYAPELNPVEQVWNHIKDGVLCSFAPRDAAHADEVATEHLAAARGDRGRLRSFFNASELPSPDRVIST